MPGEVRYHTFRQTMDGWPSDAYTRATAEEPGEAPWGEAHSWHIAEHQATWQSWRSWLGERKEDLRAPCQAACPVGANAGLYVSLIAEGRYDEALRVAAEPNPFPAICGRVCTAPCEDVCRRGEFNAPIAIRDLKRFATDHGGHIKRNIPPAKQHYAEQVAIVGAGPTGISAAYYLARRGYQVTVYDAMPVAGGMMAVGIPEYRLPRAELNRDIDAIRELGVEFRLNSAIGLDYSLDDLQTVYDAVLLAVGAQHSQRLDIPGEAAMLFGVLLVKLMGDPDHKLRDFRLVTVLLAIGSVFYFVPYVLGVQSNAVFTTEPYQSISNFLVTNTNTSWAVGIAYVSIALLAIMGAMATIYALRTGGRAEVSKTSSTTN